MRSSTVSCDGGRRLPPAGMHNAAPPLPSISCSKSRMPPSPSPAADTTTAPAPSPNSTHRSEEHTSELQSHLNLVCHAALRFLAPFPTRRSSDLILLDVVHALVDRLVRRRPQAAAGRHAQRRSAAAVDFVLEIENAALALAGRRHDDRAGAVAKQHAQIGRAHV